MLGSRAPCFLFANLFGRVKWVSNGGREGWTGRPLFDLESNQTEEPFRVSMIYAVTSRRRFLDSSQIANRNRNPSSMIIVDDRIFVASREPISFEKINDV